MVQRAGEAGALPLASTKHAIAGSVAPPETNSWEQLAGSTDGLSSTYSSTAGVYQGGEKLLAINRSVDEDTGTIVPAERVESLFANLDFDRVNQTAENSTSLIQEVWRLFLILVLLALIAEALLCIPKRITANVPGSAFSGGDNSQPSIASGFGDMSSGLKSEDVSVGGVA